MSSKSRNDLLTRLDQLTADLIPATQIANDAHKRVLEMEDAGRSDQEARQGLIDKLSVGNNKIREIEAKIRTLEGAKLNSLMTFDRNMPTLVQAINRERGWIKKPVEPMGLYVKLKDGRFGDTLETVLGDSLNTLAVENEHDHALLTRLQQLHKTCVFSFFPQRQFS